MDFSSIPRALQSLERRPNLPKELASTAQTFAGSPLPTLERWLLTEEDHWEARAVGLYVATALLGSTAPRLYLEGPRVPQSQQEQDGATFIQLTDEERIQLAGVVHQTVLQHLEDAEPRVRTLVAKAIAVYASEAHVQELYQRLSTSIAEHLQAGRDEQNPEYSKSSQGALDDTTGWRALETNWQALASLVTSGGQIPVEERLLEDCQHCSIVHVNRHVRAAAMNFLEQLVNHGHDLSIGSPLRTTLIAVLRDGLADNWSQVRMAASVLTRALWEHLPADQPKDDLLAPLLPRMCLNRFYLAQGVKLYSHETWKLIFPQGGVDAVADHLPAICRYYVKMADADNHVVREAACQAMAELATRVPQLEGHVPTLLQALLMCFYDESWPVRDEACLACGILVKAYPEECRSELGTLWERWTEQLTDQIWSVREDAAVALGDALEAYGDEMLVKIRALIDDLLPSARQQPAMTRAEYKERQNNIEAHTNSQLYSCGSLAPKLRKGGAGRIGCSNCDVNREKAPWEATDGCVYLIRELVVRCCSDESKTKLSDEQLQTLLRELVDVCRVQHFPQADDLRATLWRQVPEMAQALGKDRFKRHYLEIFVDLLFRTLDQRTASQLSKHAAGQCADELAKLVGPTIFRGRLDDYQRQLLDQVLQERRQMPRGPPDAFSPFGPPGLLDHIHPSGPAV